MGASTDPAPAPAAQASSQTIANLSSQIAQQAGQKTSRFDMQLTPDGLGRVDVAVQIDASGAVTASLSFEKADSAAMVKDQSGDLQAALASAGLSLSPDGLKFSHLQGDGSPIGTAAAQQTVSAASSSGAGAQSGGQGASQSGGQPGQHTLAAGGGHSLQSGGQSGGQAGGQSGQQDRPSGSTVAARSFQAAVSAADVVDQQTAYVSSLAARGLDIRI